jgi:HK97 family phage prohead protease
LEHSKEAVDLSFLASGRANLLLDHGPRNVVGVIEDVYLDEETRRLRAKVRFGKSELASSVYEDVKDGIRSNISVGYQIDRLERRDEKTYVAKRWKPVEASIVAIPADMSEIGIGRSAQVSTEVAESVTTESSKVEAATTETRNIEVMTMEDNVIDVQAVAAEARQAAQKNAAQIVELGARHNKAELAREAIAKGTSIEDFRGQLLDVIGSNQALDNQDIGLSQKEVKRFSILRAVRALANPHDRKSQEDAAFEFECSRAASKQYGREAEGIMLPTDVLRTWKRDLNSADEADLFGEDYRGGDFIDVLRNASSVMSAGARVLNGLSGDVRIPKKLTSSAAAWIATEGSAAAESEMTVGNISMVPRTLGAFTDATRQLMIQSSLDVENLIRDDLAQAIALAIDLAALEGSGSSGQPTGILNTSGVNTVTAFAAANPTFAEVVTLETAVAEDNALMGNLAYIMPAAMFGALKTTEKASGTAQFVVEPGGTVNGYRSIVSNQGTAGNLYFGNFADCLVGFFGGVDIKVDPYSLSTSGGVRIVALAMMDVAIRHAVSFAYGNDGA